MKPKKIYWTTGEIARMRKCSVHNINRIVVKMRRGLISHMSRLGARKYFTRDGVRIILSASSVRGYPRGLKRRKA